MNENMKLWNSVKVTAPHAVKQITGKQYKGNSPKPYWIIERATEVFGPVGFGWGITVKSERFERMSDTDVLHVAVVSVWYVLDGKRSESWDQMGGTKAVYMTNKGILMVDEDAGKKSVTDAMVKCFSMAGFAGDIFSGQWDDSKYVEWAAEETRKREQPTLTEEQQSQIAELLDGRDFEAFMRWVSKGAKREISALKDIPADAYTPIINKLTAKETA
jgi:hypothetical protein